MTKSHLHLMLAGSALAAFASPVAAQTFTSSGPQVTLPAQPQVTFAPPPQVQVPSDLPQYVLQPNKKDEYGRPIPERIEDTIRKVGVDGARQLAQDDRDRCYALTEMDQLEQQIVVAERQVREDERELAAAESETARKAAAEKLKKHKNKLFNLLLKAGKIVLGTAIGGPGYGALVALNEVHGNRRGKRWDRQMNLYDERMEHYDDRLELYDQRLELYDLRLKLSTDQNKFWRNSMGLWCRARGYSQQTTTVAYSLPAPDPHLYGVGAGTHR